MSILDQIITDKRIEVERRKSIISFDQIRHLPKLERQTISLKQKLSTRAGIIAEFKRKSPSKGIINEKASVIDTTIGYEKAGASACSILTDEPYFKGKDQDIIDARPTLSIPILRKDFIIDPYQIVEAKILGADLILLIAECLSKEEISHFAGIAHDLGMEVLMELHFDDELNKWNENIDLIGVNNRNLKNFETGIDRSLQLADKLPKESIWISESGLKGKDELKSLMQAGYNGFLIGETFMRSDDPGALCKEFVDCLNP